MELQEMNAMLIEMKKKKEFLFIRDIMSNKKGNLKKVPVKVRLLQKRF